MKRIAMLSLICCLSPICSIPAQSAAEDMKDMNMQGMDMKPIGPATVAVGVVKRVDQAKGIAVIAHEPIKSLGWPAMTMDFTVENNSLFDKLVQGKKINFEFVISGGKYIVTAVK